MKVLIKKAKSDKAPGWSGIVGESMMASDFTIETGQNHTTHCRRLKTSPVLQQIRAAPNTGSGFGSGRIPAVFWYSAPAE